MKAPIRVGILGAAKIAPPAVIVPAHDNPDFAITAVGARDPERAKAFAKQHDIPGVAAGYAELVTRDDVDLVYNALPPAMHLEWSARAMEAGKAVLCEKPFAMNAAQAREMVDAGKRTGQTLIEAFHYRHHNVLRRAFSRVSSGLLGRVERAEAVFDVPIAYAPEELRWVGPLGGGALMDLGCYTVHGLRTILGGDPRVERAAAKVQHGVDAEMDADLTFPGGVPAHLHCSMVPAKFGARLFVEGDRGSIEILNFIAPQIGCRVTVTVDGVATEGPTDGPSTYAAQLTHVADVLLRGAEPLVGGADAIANMQTIDAIYAAAGVPRTFGNPGAKPGAPAARS